MTSRKRDNTDKDTDDVAAIEHEEKKSKVIQKAPLQIWDVPTAGHYQVSFMHRRVVTGIVTSLKYGYVLTASQDGIVKFWKRLSCDDDDDDENGGGTNGKGTRSSATATSRVSTSKCLEFVKSFTAHVGPIGSLCMATSGDVACSIGINDGIIKFYDVGAFDVTGMIRTPFGATDTNSNDTNNGNGAAMFGMHATFIGKDQSLIAVSHGSSVLIYDVLTLSPDPMHTIRLHATPITAMAYNAVHQCVVSADHNGIIEVWNAASTNTSSSSSPTTNIGSAPTQVQHKIEYSSKMDTQLYDLVKKKTFGIAIAISPTGTHFCVYGADRKIRLYEHSTGKIVVTYDERAKVYDKAIMNSSNNSSSSMDAIEYGKRAATERDMNDTLIMTGGVKTENVLEITNDSASSGHQLLTIAFDPSGKYLLIPTLLGVKLIDWKRNKVVQTIGKQDASNLRFVSVCVCSGDAKVNKQMDLARTGGSSTAVNQNHRKKSDALLVLLSYKKRRLYVISHLDPVQDQDDKLQQLVNSQDKSDEDNIMDDILMRRDILNEPPDADDRFLERPSKTKEKVVSEAILRTTLGDIHFKLFTDQVPRTIENFCGHAKSGYYDNVIFHRIIKGFMLQTGDPLGDGTGGESIWGGEFEDEFERE